MKHLSHRARALRELLRVTRATVCLLIYALAIQPSNIAAGADPKKFGNVADKAIVSSHTVILNTKLQECVEEIGRRVTDVSDNPGLGFKFRVINDPVVNAYSAAGGYVYVTTGLLDVLTTEDELAAVLAHEVGHTVHDHQIKFIYGAHKRAQAGKVAGIFIGAALGAALGTATASAASAQSASALTRQAMDLGFALGARIGNAMAMSMIEGYGKKNELEADSLSIEYTIRAGYEHVALIRVLRIFKGIEERLGMASKKYASNQINCHPGLDNRLLQAGILVTAKRESDNQ